MDAGGGSETSFPLTLVLTVAEEGHSILCVRFLTSKLSFPNCHFQTNLHFQILRPFINELDVNVSAVIVSIVDPAVFMALTVMV